MLWLGLCWNNSSVFYSAFKCITSRSITYKHCTKITCVSLKMWKCGKSLKQYLEQHMLKSCNLLWYKPSRPVTFGSAFITWLPLWLFLLLAHVLTRCENSSLILSSLAQWKHRSFRTSLLDPWMKTTKSAVIVKWLNDAIVSCPICYRSLSPVPVPQRVGWGGVLPVYMCVLMCKVWACMRECCTLQKSFSIPDLWRLYSCRLCHLSSFYGAFKGVSVFQLLLVTALMSFCLPAIACHHTLYMLSWDHTTLRSSLWCSTLFIHTPACRESLSETVPAGLCVMFTSVSGRVFCLSVCLARYLASSPSFLLLWGFLALSSSLVVVMIDLCCSFFSLIQSVCLCLGSLRRPAWLHRRD